MNSAYLVGSDESQFIVDKVYGEDELEDAIAYCESRKNYKYAWQVRKAGFGADWLDWEIVHTTPKYLDDRPSKPVK